MTTENDLGLQRTSSSTAHSPEDVARLPHPAKLQHSPSLPNIRSPTSFAPNPFNMPAVKEKNQGPQAPPSPNPSAPAILLTDKSRSTTRHVKYASIDPSLRKPSGHKTHARRRTDRDQPHSLLTPPLTPSSSIRTSASISTEYSATSTAHSAHEGAKNVPVDDIVDPDPEATRIMVLENVKSTAGYNVLKSAITNAFEKACTQSGLSVIPNLAYDASSPRDLVRGLNQRLQESVGKVYALFYDARVAKVVVDFLGDPSAAATVFQDCAQTQLGDGLRSIYPTARLGTLDEIHQALGHSDFLTNLDSSFSLSVRKSKLADDSADSASLPKDVVEMTGAETGSTDSGVDVAIVLNILKPFGDLRSFKFSRQEVGQDLSSTCYYSVEYFDARDCDAAWIELDKATKYGLVLNVSGNKLKPKTFAEVEAEAAPEHFVPAHPAATVTESFANLNISTPGTNSQLRLPFFHPQGNAPSGETVNTQPAPQAAPQPSGGASSPPFFYVTPSGEPALPPYPVADPSDAAARVRALVERPPSTPFLEEQWGQEGSHRPGAGSPCYNADGACPYCPPYAYVYGAFTTPPPTTPMLYYPPRLQPTPQMLPPHPPPWAFDPAVAAVGPGGVQPTMMPAPPPVGGIMTGPPPSPVPFFIRDGGSGVPAGGRGPPFAPPFPPYARGHPPAPFSPAAAHAPASRPDLPPTGGVLSEAPRMSKTATTARVPVRVREPSPPIHHAASLQVAAEAAAGGHDRNTLDLARIREGLDTRTTMMIKNIPNKMSDADLTAYIAKVCPRAIDFLYLRMDFRNGCNVGYAFVNFIAVEDLLRFADARLGAKWNMFSSEKVLQMSYANFQSKESLIEKFKNSAIMDERESWRPRIFYSSGPMKGLPEPFPMPTHIRRKERSSHNRGTLFPPGMNSHTTGSHRRLLVANSNPRLPSPPVSSSPFASIVGRNPGGAKPMGFRGKRFL